MIKRFRVRPKIYLDFGTANCVIIKEGQGIVLNEPTVVAISVKEKKVVAVGSEAKQMLGKEPEGLIARRPLRNGGISHYDLASKLLTNFMDKALGNLKFIKPDVIVSVPSRLHSIEERALVKALEEYGVNKVTLFPEALAAAKGAGLPIDKPVGSLIANLGGGTAEIAMISLNKVVKSVSQVGTGDALNNAIINAVRNELEINIGEQTAERIKLEIGTAFVDNPELKLTISGKDLTRNLPVTKEITSRFVRDAIKSTLDNIIEAIREVIDNSPSELVSDIADRGIALSGGTALLKNIDIYLTKSLSIPCYVVEDPLTCVVRGMAGRE
ncbi:MAG: rod shape-determining protein [Candidatus Dojkabacteria bacterium]